MRLNENVGVMRVGVPLSPYNRWNFSELENFLIWDLMFSQSVFPAFTIELLTLWDSSVDIGAFSPSQDLLLT